MTLADLIRRYLEDRRERYTQKTWIPEQDKNVSSYSKNFDDGLVTIDNKQYFSNNIDPKSDRFNGFPQSTVTRQMGVSKSKRMINLPDGSIQIETIIRDSNGNEEKHITTQKGDKKHTIIIRKDASGIEHTEEKVTDANDHDEFILDSRMPSSSRPDLKNGVDSGYDFWFHKFFEPKDTPLNDDVFKKDNFPFDFNANPDEQIEKLLKQFSHGKFFDPFSEVFKNNDVPKNKDGFEEVTSESDFTKFNDSVLNEETRSLIENFEKSTTNSPKSSMKKKNQMSSKQMERLLKSVAPPPPPSIFEQLAENAVIEIPEEKTPLDRFIKPDEDQKKALQSLRRERDNAINKLNKYFSLSLDKRAKDVYSDINNGGDADVSLILPQPESRRFPYDFGEIFRKPFDGNIFGGSSQTRMFIDNGKKRVESIRRNEQGLVQKTVSYEIGSQQYSVVIVTDKSGKVLKRNRNFNFSEEELPRFKKLWSEKFQSDFEE